MKWYKYRCNLHISEQKRELDLNAVRLYNIANEEINIGSRN